MPGDSARRRPTCCAAAEIYSPDGLVAALRARGYEIIEPWNAR